MPVTRKIAGGAWRTNKALYWKNGEAVVLSEGGGPNVATSLFVVGQDVYVCGYGLDSEGKIATAKYWKNGTEVLLSDGKTNIKTSSIFVSGDDV